jgi:hypothetical protein
MISYTGHGSRRQILDGRRKSNGQAMVEFLVAAIFFLVPLFLAISILGKFSDVQHTAESAARYATWERTIWYENSGSGFHSKNGPNTKSSAEIRNETAARILNDRAAAIIVRSNDRNANGFINGLDPMWNDPAGVAYLENYAQLGSAVTMNATTSQNALAATIIVPPIISTLEMPSNSLAIAAVEFRTVAQNSGTYQRLWNNPAWAGLDFAARGAILSNTWAANASSGTKAMVTPLVPTATPVMGTPLTGVFGAMGVWDLVGVSDAQVGKIAVDELPPDRLLSP